MRTPRVPFVPSWRRKPLRAPAGGPLIVFPIVNVEHWVFEAPMPRGVLPAPGGVSPPPPDVPNWSWQEYGWRCGLPRLLELFARLAIRPTASANGDVVNAYPEMAAAMHKAGWEFSGHGWVQQTMAKVADERETIRRTQAALEGFTGKLMRGWMGPGLVQTYDTADLLKEAGVEWNCDWPVDDLPFEIETKHGPLLGLPYTFELNDIVIYLIQNHRSDEIYRRLQEGLPLYLEEAKREPRILPISIHPYLMGVPHRFQWCARLFEELKRLPDAVFLTGSEIADWYLGQR
jgi:peptidoglycan/xylan/chitin deacetylase (PgdA/CDA1 family)